MTAYRVELTDRAARDLKRLYVIIDAEDTAQANAWFNRLEQAVLSLGLHPARGAPIPEDKRLRQLLHGRKGHRYRIIYAIDEHSRVVTVLHIRHGSRAAFAPGDSNEDA